MKTSTFLKNGLISSVPFMLGGIAGAKVSENFTDNHELISTISTTTQYVAGYATFLYLNAKDQKEVYKQNGKWKLKELAKDTGKLMFSLATAEVAYALGRTAFFDYLIRKDWFNTSTSSIAADLVSIPLYFGVAIPMAKKLGAIKKGDSLEKEVIKKD